MMNFFKLRSDLIVSLAKGKARWCHMVLKVCIFQCTSIELIYLICRIEVQGREGSILKIEWITSELRIHLYLSLLLEEQEDKPIN